MTLDKPVGVRPFQASGTERANCCEYFAFLVQRTPHGYHAGAAYRPSDRQVRFVHLAWEDRVENDWNADGLACEPQLPKPFRVVCAEIARQVAKRYTQRVFPYDFGLGGAKFDDDGSFRPGRTNSGLTCASFVAAIFEGGVHVPLVDEDGLPDRTEETTCWVESLPGNPPELKPRMRTSVANGAKRLKPAEALAAAGWPNPFPADANWCVGHGKEVERSI